jgi:hypothetical protein
MQTHAPAAPPSQQHSVRFLDPSPLPPVQTTTVTIPRPVTQLYQSHQTSAPGHPPSGRPGQSSFQPFLGINSLGVNLSTGHANHARLASASTSLPRQPTLSRRTSRSTRTRGPATQPPSLPLELAPGSALQLRSCFVAGTADPVVRLTVKVYPPLVGFLICYWSCTVLTTRLQDHGHKHILFRFLKESFDAWLERHDLVYRWDVPTSTLVRSLLLQVKDEMESSPSSYRFAPVRRLSSQEGLPLEALGVLSRGQPAGSANQVYLRPHPLDRRATVAQLVADRHRFTPQACIDGDRVILHLGKRAFY